MSDLKATWSDKTDRELAEAAANIGDYTEAGRRAIEEELQRRGAASPTPKVASPSVPKLAELRLPGDAAPLSKEVIVFTVALPILFFAAPAGLFFLALLGWGAKLFSERSNPRLAGDPRRKPTTYHVYQHPRAGHYEQLVKNGFSWPAFLFSFWWAIFKRQPLRAAGLFVAEALLLSLFIAFYRLEAPDSLASILSQPPLIAFRSYIGARGNRWTKDRLKARGYRLAAQFVPAGSREEAQRWFRSGQDTGGGA